MDKKYSVLMSVYDKEKPEYLNAALKSILDQTLPPYEIVLVCDGVLTDQLEAVIQLFTDQLQLVRLSENRGLGRALAEGLTHCRCEWVARMDSDDIAAPDRCERQLAYIWEHQEIDVLSGVVAEFTGDALTADLAIENVFALKYVPLERNEVADYIKYRNPVNHPCVMFRKSKVLDAGGYRPCYLFEDYDLWMRMFQNHCVFMNLPEVILYMRVNDMHKRRGGIRYAGAIIRFRTRMYRYGIITFLEYIYTTLIRVGVSLLPNSIRKIIYDRMLRNH